MDFQPFEPKRSFRIDRIKLILTSFDLTCYITFTLHNTFPLTIFIRLFFYRNFFKNRRCVHQSGRKFFIKICFFYITDLIHCTNEPNVSIPQLANLLIERSQNTNWTVVFKALITVHHMLCYGNEVNILLSNI